QPLFPRRFFVRVVVWPAIPQILWRAERWFVDEIPHHIVNALATFREGRDELLLRFNRSRIEISIFTAPRLGKKSEKSKDDRDVVLVCGEQKRIESAQRRFV